MAEAAAPQGVLCVVEGIADSGQEEQCDLLVTWLRNVGYPTIALGPLWSSAAPEAQWGSTCAQPLTMPAITPTARFLQQAAILAERVATRVQPGLQAGAVVMTNGALCTGLIEGLALGLNGAWLRQLFSFMPRPTVTFLLRLPADAALKRGWTVHGAGAVAGADGDTSARQLYKRLDKLYGELVDEFGLTVIDAAQPPVLQQAQMRALLQPHLAGLAAASPASQRSILAGEGVTGRYLPAQEKGGRR